MLIKLASIQGKSIDLAVHVGRKITYFSKCIDIDDGDEIMEAFCTLFEMIIFRLVVCIKNSTIFQRN